MVVASAVALTPIAPGLHDRPAQQMKNSVRKCKTIHEIVRVYPWVIPIQESVVSSCVTHAIGASDTIVSAHMQGW